MKTGIELIAEERQEQIEKHGRAVTEDQVCNTRGQLSFAIVSLCSEYDVKGNLCPSEQMRLDHFFKWSPIGWDKTLWMKMISKPYLERLKIAGALAAAEIDRLNADAELTETLKSGSV